MKFGNSANSFSTKLKYRGDFVSADSMADFKVEDSHRGGEIKKGLWTEKEDAILAQCVQKFKEGNWSTIAAKSGLNRRGKSCRLRWVKHLSPSVRNGPLTEEEQRKVVELQAKFGNKWALIASKIPGRSDNTIKNFWNSYRKRAQKRAQLMAFAHLGSAPVSTYSSPHASVREALIPTQQNCSNVKTGDRVEQAAFGNEASVCLRNMVSSHFERGTRMKERTSNEVCMASCLLESTSSKPTEACMSDISIQHESLLKLHESLSKTPWNVNEENNILHCFNTNNLLDQSMHMASEEKTDSNHILSSSVVANDEPELQWPFVHPEEDLSSIAAAAITPRKSSGFGIGSESKCLESLQAPSILDASVTRGDSYAHKVIHTLDGEPGQENFSSASSKHTSASVTPESRRATCPYAGDTLNSQPKLNFSLRRLLNLEPNHVNFRLSEPRAAFSGTCEQALDFANLAALLTKPQLDHYSYLTHAFGMRSTSFPNF